MEVSENDVARLTDYMEQLMFKMKTVDRECLGGLTGEMNFPEFQVLIFIGKNGPSRMSDIAGRLSMSVSNLTVVVDKLAKKELAERARSEADRRVVVARLLEKGERIVAYHHGMKLGVSREVLSSLSREEQEKYMELMEKIIGHG